MTTSPTQPNAALDPIDEENDRRNAAMTTNLDPIDDADLNVVIKTITWYADITGEYPIYPDLNAALNSINARLAVPADQRQRTIDSLNTSIETWAESTGRRDDPVKSKGGMFFDPAEPTFGEYAWNRMNAVPADHVAEKSDDV